MEQEPQVIALLGLGTIGLSFCALHLLHAHPSALVRAHDPRPDLPAHVRANLPVYLRTLHHQQQQKRQQQANATDGNDADSGEPPSVESLLRSGRLTLCPTLESACAGEGPDAVPATVIQEQGPESLAFKRELWAAVAAHASPDAHLWSSTSGIFASLQTQPSPSAPSASSAAAAGGTQEGGAAAAIASSSSRAAVAVYFWTF